ncbi:hypothetical protein N5C04_13135, partial [Acinetobacter baumannii]|nr:hypothetical protein [Acinetobacter baumannii]
EWVHVQLHQQKGMISLSPPTICNSADGIAMGFISYALVKLFTGKAKTVPYMVWIIAALWVFKFIAFGG